MEPGSDLEIACDESGSEGEKLVGGTTDVFAHASVLIDVGAAAAVIEQVRIGARSPANEVKASVVLREQNRWVLEWLLEPGGPLDGNAWVHLTEKAFHLTTKLVELLAPSRMPEDARTLHRAAARQVGAEGWLRALEGFNDLMRARSRPEAWVAVDRFYGRVDRLLTTGPAQTDDDVSETLRRLARSRPASDADVLHLLDRSRGVTVLDPLVPALARTVAHWHAAIGPVRIVHDVQATLTPERIGDLRELRGPDELASIRFVESHADPRVQVADLLAGAARRVASDALAGQEDPGLVALLRPYLDCASTWGDDASWSVLVGTGGGSRCSERSPHPAWRP